MESANSQFHPLENIIVIEPGSQFLRIGFANDACPQIVRHVIARVCRTSIKNLRRDKVLPDEVSLSRPQMVKVQRACAKLSHTLHSFLLRRIDEFQNNSNQVSLAQLATLNQRIQPVRILADSNGEAECLDDHGSDYTDSGQNSDFLIGETALREALKCEGVSQKQYHVHYPIRRGRLHTGSSRMEIVADLRDIWHHCIVRRLGVRAGLSQLRHFGAVLVVPCVLPRSDVSVMLHVLFDELNFGRVMVLSQAAAASFGLRVSAQLAAGRSDKTSAICVVNLGDQTTSVSCVIDGCCVPCSCVHTDCGGGDVSVVWLWLLRRAGFPYRQLRSSDIHDALLLDSLKRCFGGAELTRCVSPQLCTFQVRKPHHAHVKYSVNIGLDSVLAALSVFRPEMFCLTGQHGIICHPHRCPDIESGLLSCVAGRQHDDSSGVDVDRVMDRSKDKHCGSDGDEERRQCCDETDAEQPLDVMILSSIERTLASAGTANIRQQSLRRQLLTNIVLTGGGSRTAQLAGWLQERLDCVAPAADDECEQGGHVYVEHRIGDGVDFSLSWRGVRAVLCTAPSVDLWCIAAQWRVHGVNAVRRHSSFRW